MKNNSVEGIFFTELFFYPFITLVFILSGCKVKEGDERDTEILVRAVFYTEPDEGEDTEVDDREEQPGIMDGLAGLRACAYRSLDDKGICREINMPRGAPEVILRVPSNIDWTLRMWAFDRRGKAVWSGGSRVFSMQGYRMEAEVLMTQCSRITPLIPGSGKMPLPRAYHSSTLLPGGKILLAGGFEEAVETVCTVIIDENNEENNGNGEGNGEGEGNSGNGEGNNGGNEENNVVEVPCRLLKASSRAHVYDPALGIITHEIKLRSPRAMHTATLTADRRYVILAGGVVSAVIYLDGEWPLIVPRSFPVSSEAEHIAELVDPHVLKSAGEIPLSGPRFFHAAVDDGQDGALLLGGKTMDNGITYYVGSDGTSVSIAEFVNAEGSLRVDSDKAAFRRGHAAVRADERVLVVGGNELRLSDPGFFAEYLDPESGSVNSFGDDQNASVFTRRYAPMWHSLTKIENRFVALGGIYAGSSDDNVMDSPDGLEIAGMHPISHGMIFTQEEDEDTVEGLSIHSSRAAHTASVIEGERILLIGGLTAASEYNPLNHLRVTASMEIFDINTGDSDVMRSPEGRTLRMPGPLFGHQSSLLKDGNVLVSGGINAVFVYSEDNDSDILPELSILTDVHIINPSSITLEPEVSTELLNRQQ